MKADAATRRRRLRTPAVWLVLAALAAGAAVFDHFGPREAHDDGHGHGAGPRFLVSAPIGSLAAAEIVFDGVLWRFERDGSGAWRHGEARDADASARIAAAFDVLGRAQTVRELPEAGDPDLYGVSDPFLSLALWTRDAEAPARYLFGDMAPDGLNRYVLTAPRAERDSEHGSEHGSERDPEHEAERHSDHESEHDPDHEAERHPDHGAEHGPEMATVPEYHTDNLVGLVRSFDPR